MYYNISFMFENPISFYTTEEPTEETVDKETYDKYLSGRFLKGENGEPVEIPIEEEKKTNPILDMPALPNEELESKDISEPYLREVFRIAHGEKLPVIAQNESIEIIAMQLSGDNFNSPNVGKNIKPPKYPFYNGLDFLAGINEDNQAYISNQLKDVDTVVSGWLTIKISSN